MKFTSLRSALAFLLFLTLLGGTGFSQFKKVYAIDTFVLRTPSLFTAVKVIETDISGRQVSVVGSIITSDTANVSRAELYHLQCNLQGEPQDLHLLEDTSVFAFESPRAYGGCYDGNGIFYIGGGSNSRQIIVKTDGSGTMHWTRAGHHHEYYSLICEGGSVSFLGQDESIQGAHDFSFSRFDSTGAGGPGTMFGTPNFELPLKMAKIDNQYIMAGSSFQAGAFDGLLVKSSPNFEQIWGNVIHLPGKSTFMYGITPTLDGHGYIVSGRARGGADSLFIMKTDTAGNPIWTKLYGISDRTEVYSSGMVMDPVSGGYILSGHYKGTQWSRPYLIMTDSMGNVRWARDYGNSGTNTDETLNDVIHCQADGMFCAVGDMVEIDSNLYIHKILMVKVAADSGSVPCDSALAIGVSTITAQIVGASVEEPFDINTHFPMGNLISATLNAETRCSVIVGFAEHLPTTGLFHIVNPSGSTLQLRAEVPIGGANLIVTSLTGELILREALDEGDHQAMYALPQLSNGMYLVSLAGSDWRYPTLRWVVQR